MERLAQEHHPRVEALGPLADEIPEPVRVRVRVDDLDARQIHVRHRHPPTAQYRHRCARTTSSGSWPSKTSRSARRVARNESNSTSPIASRSIDDFSSSPIASPERCRELTDPQRTTLPRRDRRRIVQHRIGQRQLALETVDAGGHDRAEGEVGVRGRIHGLHLEVRRVRSAPDHPGHEAQGRFAILPPPACPRSAPPMGLQSLIARDRRSGDRGERRERREHARRERLGLARHALRSASSLEQVPAVPVPQAQVQMVPVAHPLGEDDRRERHGVPVVPRDGPDRVAHDEVRVRRRDPDAVGHRQFELAGRVLRVELHHTGALLLEGPDQRGRERLDVGERDRAVGGPRVGRRRVRLVRTRCGAMAEEELDLVAAAELEPVAARVARASSARTCAGSRGRARPPGRAGRRVRAPIPGSRRARPSGTGSGISRVSPVGPAMCGEDVI